MENVYVFGYEEVRGRAYIDLLNTCFQYGRYFSLSAPAIFEKTLYPTYADVPALKPFLHFEYSTLRDVYYGTLYTPWPTLIRVYHCCEETKKILLSTCKTLFSWLAHGPNHMPEDLTFFREDGSVFMEQMSHERECALFPHENENIDAVLRTGAWSKKKDKDGEEWLRSPWTALRIAPQILPTYQQAYIESKKAEWEDWPSWQIKSDQKSINEYREKKDFVSLKDQIFGQQILKKIYLEKWGREYKG